MGRSSPSGRAGAPRRPRRCASRRPSLVKMLERCRATVLLADDERRAAISALVPARGQGHEHLGLPVGETARAGRGRRAARRRPRHRARRRAGRRPAAPRRARVRRRRRRPGAVGLGEQQPDAAQSYGACSPARRGSGADSTAAPRRGVPRRAGARRATAGPRPRSPDWRNARRCPPARRPSWRAASTSPAASAISAWAAQQPGPGQRFGVSRGQRGAAVEAAAASARPWRRRSSASPGWGSRPELVGAAGRRPPPRARSPRRRWTARPAGSAPSAAAPTAKSASSAQTRAASRSASLPVALDLQDLGPVHPADAHERAAAGMRLAPARGRLRPLGGPAEVAELVAGRHQVAVDVAGPGRVHLSDEHRQHRLVQQGHTVARPAPA